MLTVSSLAVAIGTGRAGAAMWELHQTHQGVKQEPDGWSVVWTAGEKRGIRFPALQAWPLAPAIVSRSPPALSHPSIITFLGLAQGTACCYTPLVFLRWDRPVLPTSQTTVIAGWTGLFSPQWLADWRAARKQGKLLLWCWSAAQDKWLQYFPSNFPCKTLNAAGEVMEVTHCVAASHASITEGRQAWAVRVKSNRDTDGDIKGW